jgi:hypothetical protein
LSIPGRIAFYGIQGRENRIWICNDMSPSTPLIRRLDFLLMNLRARRLDDRIRKLCIDAVDAQDSLRAKSILFELRAAIHQYTQRLRAQAAAVLTGRDLPAERRERNGDRRKSATP